MKKIGFCIVILLGILVISGCEKDGILISEGNGKEEYLTRGDISEEYLTRGEMTDEYLLEENKWTGNGLDETGYADLANKKMPCVYLCGAVNNPGIYEITEGTRLYEIVEEAGGLDEEADIDSINLAAVVKDEEQIRIPYIGETIVVEEDSRVNINTASVEELCKIPGIGESRAKAIIDYRESAGGFETEEELMQISGIKSATFNKIKNYIRVK